MATAKPMGEVLDDPFCDKQKAATTHPSAQPEDTCRLPFLHAPYLA